MLKFFAKYNKIILVVGGSLLMVVFLLPAGGQILMPDATSQVIGTVDGDELTTGDRQTAAAELELLANMFPAMAASLPTDPTAWLLVQHEARTHGVYVSRQQALGTIRQIQEQGMDIGRLLGNSGASEDLFVQALRHLEMYNQLANMIVGAQHPSAPRLRHFAQDIRSQASARVACVDASYLLNEASEPSEEALRAHFEEYKDDAPGTSEPYGMGYRLPARVRIEYISVPLQRVAATVEVNEVDAYRYYLENPERFMPSPTSTPETPETSQDPASEQNGEGEAAEAESSANEPLPYKQVRERVREELAAREAQAKQERVIRSLSAALNERTRRLPTGPQGYYQLGEDYQPPSFEELAGQVQEEFGVLPDVVRIENDWLTLEELSGLEGIGNAVLMGASGPIPIAEYVASVRELDTPAMPELASLNLQEDVASRPVVDNAGNQYIFRVTEAQPAHEPESLDEVRDQVAEDVKRLAAYERLQQRSQELLEQAKAEGLSGFAEAFNTEVRSIGPFAGRDLAAMFMEGRLDVPTLPMVGQSEAFVDAVFATAQDVQQAGGLGEVGPEQALGVVAVDGEQRMCVFEVTNYQPVDSGTFARIKPGLPRMIAQSDMRQFAGTNPLSFEAVARRVGFEESQAFADPTEGDSAGEDMPISGSPLLR